MSVSSVRGGCGLLMEIKQRDIQIRHKTQQTNHIIRTINQLTTRNNNAHLLGYVSAVVLAGVDVQRMRQHDKLHNHQVAPFGLAVTSFNLHLHHHLRYMGVVVSGICEYGLGMHGS